MTFATSDQRSAYTMLYRSDGTEHGYWCSICFGIPQYRAPELRPPHLYTAEELHRTARKQRPAAEPANR